MVEYKQGTFEEYREGIINVRQKVFVEEQKCPVELEWNEEEEKESTYFVCLKDNKVVACVRIRKVGQDLVKLERVAVLIEFRRRRIATELIGQAMFHCQTTMPNTSIYAFAQVSAIQVYVSLGFCVLSKVWIEDATFIPHQTIFWSNPQAIEVFLNHEKERSSTDDKIEDYDIHHPALTEKIERMKQRMEEFEYFNIQSLHCLMNDKVLTQILINRFMKLCNLVDAFLELEPFSEEKTKKPKTDIEHEKLEISKLMNFLTKIADQKLNTGHFNEVHEDWRVLYGLVEFMKSFMFFKQEKYEIAMIHADKGLCMGRVDEDYVPLRKLARLVHEMLEKPIDCEIHTSYMPPSSVKMLTPLSKTTRIEECSDDDSTFERLLQCVHTSKPLLIRNYAQNSKACQKWNFSFLLNELHSRTFPIEIGSKYSDENWSQKMMKFKEFIQNPKNEQLYLAQHRLLDQVPHLKHDIMIPDICFINSDDEENVDMNIWIGPFGTISPLHTDPRNNIFVQYHGTKVVRMVSPKDTKSIYPIDGMLSNTSEVDVENPDYDDFPDFAEIETFDAVVNAGDALFIPEKWWHYVRSVTPSISVSFWFD